MTVFAAAFVATLMAVFTASAIMPAEKSVLAQDAKGTSQDVSSELGECPVVKDGEVQGSSTNGAVSKSVSKSFSSSRSISESGGHAGLIDVRVNDGVDVSVDDTVDVNDNEILNDNNVEVLNDNDILSDNLNNNVVDVDGTVGSVLGILN